MANELKSNKGSQIIKVIEGNGVVTIWAYDTKKHVANSVTIFDELLIDVASKLSAIALQRRKLTKRALDEKPSSVSSK